MMLEAWRFFLPGLLSIALAIPLFAQSFRWEATQELLQTDVTALHVTRNGNILAGTSAGIYRSEDKGDSFNKTDISTDRIWAFGESMAGVIFAGTSSLGLLRTEDEGKSWEQTTADFPHIRAIAITPRNNIYIGTYYDGVLLSNDGGKSWRQSGLNTSRIRALTSLGEDILLVGTDGDQLYRSQNGGRHWEHLNSFFTKPYVWCFATTRDSTVYSGTGDGVFLSMDWGSSWQQTSLDDHSVWTLAIDSRGIIYAGIWESGVFVSVDGGLRWKHIGLKNINIWDMVIYDENTVIAGGDTLGIFRMHYVEE